MSPEPPSRDTARISLADALKAIGQGVFSHRVLIAFSDLGRDQMRLMRTAWIQLETPVRIRLVRALGELAEESVLYHFGRVFRVALDDPDAAVRQVAIAALWEDTGSDLIDDFLRLLDDPSQDVRAEAASALGRFAVQAMEGDLEPATGDRLFAVLSALASDPGESYIVRRRALESVAAFGNRGNCYALIREAFDHDDHGMRAGALFAMGRTLDARWLSAITGEFESDDPEMRYEAARAAGEIGDDRAIGGLAGLCADGDAEVRFGAVTALGKIGNAASLKILRRLAERSSGEEREAILEAIRQTEIDFSESTMTD